MSGWRRRRLFIHIVEVMNQRAAIKKLDWRARSRAGSGGGLFIHVAEGIKQRAGSATRGDRSMKGARSRDGSGGGGHREEDGGGGQRASDNDGGVGRRMGLAAAVTRKAEGRGKAPGA